MLTRTSLNMTRLLQLLQHDQADQCQYSSTDSHVDTSESDSDLPCSAECSRYLINNAADNARADLAAALLRATPQLPTNSTVCVDGTVVGHEATSNIEGHRSERTLIDLRLINMAMVTVPQSLTTQHRHYESNLLPYSQTNCAHRLGAVMACVPSHMVTNQMAVFLTWRASTRCQATQTPFSVINLSLKPSSNLHKAGTPLTFITRG